MKQVLEKKIEAFQDISNIKQKRILKNFNANNL